MTAANVSGTRDVPDTVRSAVPVRVSQIQGPRKQVLTYSPHIAAKWRDQIELESLDSKAQTRLNRVFPGSPAVRTPSFYCRGHRFHPWSGN